MSKKQQLIDAIAEMQEDEAMLVVQQMLDEARPENVKAMFEFTRAYGVYR